MNAKTRNPKILLIGAGAVGQVYGRHLQLAGCDVSFFVRAKYADEARQGYWMYPLKTARPRYLVPTKFESFGVVTDFAEVSTQTWDQVWLCVSSTALLNGQWLRALLASIGDATLVMLQPGIDDREQVLRQMPTPKQSGTGPIVTGMISFISFHAPLKPQDSVPHPGMAYWLPPLSPSLFSGAADRVGPVVSNLNRGGCPAKISADVAAAAAIPSAVLMTLLCGLEAADWSLSKFLKGEHGRKSQLALQEAVTVVAKRFGQRPPRSLSLLTPGFFRLALPCAMPLVPFDLETYLKVHFTKVGDQTRLNIQSYIHEAKKQGLPNKVLEEALALIST